MKNLDIRKQIQRSGLRHWQVAEALGISEATLCRRLRFPLAEEHKTEILNCIKDLIEKEENNGK